MVSIVALIFFICTLRAQANEQPSSEQDHTITSVPMQSVVLPCKAVLPHKEPERVMWYKIINPDQWSTISVNNQLITKDSRFSVAYYRVDHGFTPAKWDLYITNLRLSDAARYQCHVITKDIRKSTRSNVRLIVEDIIVDIQPIDVYVSIGDKTEFSCNFTGAHRVRREKVTWLKDGRPLTADATRVTTSTELPDVTVTTLQIVASHSNDSGLYRCSDGHGAQSKEAKLHIRDADEPISLRSSSSIRTVFYSFILQSFFFSFYSLNSDSI